MSLNLIMEWNGIDNNLDMLLFSESDNFLGTLSKLSNAFNFVSVIILCHENYDFIRKLIYLAQDQGMTDPSSYVWITFYNIYGQFSLNMFFYPWEKELDDKKDYQTRKMAFEAVKIVMRYLE